MFTKSIYPALLLTGLIASPAVFAEDQVGGHKAYVQFNAGAAFVPTLSQTGLTYVCTHGHYPCSAANLTQKETYDTGFVGSVAIGYQIAEQFRLEAEALFQSNDLGKYSVAYSPWSNFNYSYDSVGERERTAFLLNAYYDFKNSTNFTPYLTAGLGGYHMRVKRQYSSVANDLDFAWQAGAGVNYRLNDRISLDLKYRYFGGSDAELQRSNQFGTSSELVEVGDHQVLAGIRVGF